MARKKRVLFVSEAAYLSTGYATYSNQILRKLKDTNKYELAEFSIYGSADDPRRQTIPWKNYPNMPDSTATEEEKKIFESNPSHVFGGWRFERACLDFKPDVVLTIRDFWMDAFVYESPYRRLFKWIWMPTVDASPQNEEWIHQFADADSVLTYSDWAKEVIDSQSGGNVNTVGVASPSASDDYQMVENKSQAKKDFGFPEDFKIIGSVMRNQRRKLYPVLFEAFSKYLKKTGDTKTYLHCHTSYPDGGWDFGELLHRYDISSRVIFTYICSDSNCRAVEICKFNDSRKMCNNCRKFTSTQTNVNNGVNDEVLARIYNLYDLYIQCANCEGFGLPQVEAAACGVPVACTNYSAMEDIVKKLNAYPIEVDALYKELETGCDRAVPSVDSLTQIMYNFFNQSQEEINNKRVETRRLFEENYTWEKSAETWMKAIDALDYADWSVPAIIKPNIDIDANRQESNFEFLTKCANAYLIDGSRIHSHVMRVFLRDLNSGSFKPPSDGFFGNEFSPNVNRSANQVFDRKKVVEVLKNKLNNSNAWENVRTNPQLLTDGGAKWLNS